MITLPAVWARRCLSLTPQGWIGRLWIEFGLYWTIPPIARAPCLAREQVFLRALFMMCTSRTSTSALATSESASGTHNPCARSPPCSAGAWDHTSNSVSQNTLCLSAYRSQRSTPANSHSCLFYICLPFLAPRVVASKSQQGASSWMDQLISFRCPNSQWVGNGFWSKATLRQRWKGRLDDKLQNLKCRVSN